MMRAVLLFSGQGAQRVGMGADFFDAEPVQAMVSGLNDVVGYDLRKVMLEGPMEELTRTSRCQPALYLHGLMTLAMLKQALPELEPVGYAGLSLGEFTAHAAAGTFSFQDGLSLVAARGAYMEEACAETDGGMIAMIGGEEDAVRALAKDSGMDIANFNAPGQIVLSGPKAALEIAKALASERGLRGKELPVAGAYHSQLMHSAREKLRAKLATTQIHAPTLPVVSNVDAVPHTVPDDIRDSLVRQVTGSVRWVQCVRHFADQGCTTFLELGPDSALAGMVRRIHPEATVHSIKGRMTLNEAVEALREHA